MSQPANPMHKKRVRLLICVQRPRGSHWHAPLALTCLCSYAILVEADNADACYRH